MASTDARPVPIKNTAYRAVFPIYDNTGSLVTGAAGLDSEVSKDQGTFTDCTNEATEIATASGIYYLDVTSTEMNADCTAIIVKTSTTNAKTTVIVLYPQESGDIKVDLQSIAGSAVSTSTAQLGVNLVNIAGAAVSTSTAQLGVNIVNYGGNAGTFAAGRPEVNTSHWGGTAVATAVVLAAANIASNAFTATKFAAGAFDAVWSVAARILTAATNITSTGGTTVPQTGDNFARLGAPAGASVSADIAAVKVDTAAVKAKTDNLPSDPADASDIAAAFSIVNATLMTIPTANANADALLGRNVNGGSSTGRLVKDAFKRLRNRVAIAAGTMTVYEENDSSAAWTATVTKTAGDPVSQVDPS